MILGIVVQSPLNMVMLFHPHQIVHQSNVGCPIKISNQITTGTHPQVYDHFKEEKGTLAMTRSYSSELPKMMRKLAIASFWICLLTQRGGVQAWTNGRYKSVYHRVALNSIRPRLSTAFFLSQDDDVIVAPLAELISEDCPTKYKPFTYHSYREFIVMHMKDLGSHEVLSKPHRLDYLTTSA